MTNVVQKQRIFIYISFSLHLFYRLVRGCWIITSVVFGETGNIYHRKWKNTKRGFFFFSFCQMFSCTDLTCCWCCLWYRDASTVANCGTFVSFLSLCLLFFVGFTIIAKNSAASEEASTNTWRTLLKGSLLVRVRLGDLNDFSSDFISLRIKTARKGQKTKQQKNIWINEF